MKTGNRLLLIDNYDSFTYNLKDYFEQLGQEVLVKRNDDIMPADLKYLSFSKIVISPGPKTPSEAGSLMDIIDAYHTQYPMLGICLGHQALGQYFGCKLVKANKPMHGKVSAILHNEKGIYLDIPNPLNVCRYHSLLLKDIANTPLQPTAAVSESGELMSFRHCDLPLTGIQYHPEAILTEHGLDILRNWLQLSH